MIPPEQLARAAERAAAKQLLGQRTPTPQTSSAPTAAPVVVRAKGEVLAVFDLEDVGQNLGAGESDQLTAFFSVQLAILGYKVVPRAQLREQLSSEKQESYKSCYDESCQIELGKAVAAQKSVMTKMLKMGSTCAFTATLYDLRSETTEHAASVETRCNQEERFAGLKQLARELVPRP